MHPTSTSAHSIAALHGLRGTDHVHSTPRRPPARLWTTGSLAMVMLTLGASSLAARDSASSRPRVLLHSPHDLNETVARIEGAVRRQGMTVLARLRSEHCLLVLGSADRVTPILTTGSDSRPQAPWLVHVREIQSGGTEVQLSDDLSGRADWDALPPDVIRCVVGLPHWLEAALG